MDVDASNWNCADSMEELEVCKIILRMAAGEGSKVELTQTARAKAGEAQEGSRQRLCLRG